MLVNQEITKHEWIVLEIFFYFLFVLPATDHYEASLVWMGLQPFIPNMAAILMFPTWIVRTNLGFYDTKILQMGDFYGP